MTYYLFHSNYFTIISLSIKAKAPTLSGKFFQKTIDKNGNLCYRYGKPYYRKG